MRTKRIRADAKQLRGRPAVVFASEPMDDDTRWEPIEPGQLVHVDAGLRITRRLVLPDPPARQLRREDLNPVAAAAQHPAV
jgi:glutamine amidotransferase